jgi:hypothetical protein
VLHFPFGDELLHRPGNVFDRNPRIDTVLIEQVDRLDTQALQRSFDRAPDRVGAAVETRKLLPALTTMVIFTRSSNEYSFWIAATG